MTKTQLEKWALDIFWPRYVNLCKVPYPTKWTGGQRGEAVQKILTLNPPEALRDRILAAISEQTIHRSKLYEKLGRSAQTYEKQTKYNKFYTNRNGATWINQKGWNDEIPSLSEIDTNKPETGGGGFECRLCPAQVKIRFTICKKCEKEYRKRDRELHAENLEKMGFSVRGRTLEEINKDIKDSKQVNEYFRMLARAHNAKQSNSN